MRILFFHRWVGVHCGGTETHILELAKRFCDLGHDISILTRQGNRISNIDKRIRVIRISKNFRESDHSYDDFRLYIHTVLFIFKSLFKLFSLNLQGESFDIISVHFVTEAIVARLYRLFTGIPFIFVLEGYTPMEANTARYADLRIAISNFEAGIYKQRHNIDSQVIYVGVDVDRFLVKKEVSRKVHTEFIGDDELLILTVCRIEPRKDLFTLLRAAQLVNQENKKIKFIIVGEGILSSAIAIAIKEYGLSSVVKLAGFVDDKQLPYYYAIADIFVLTSNEEWFGIVFLEAMSAGLPIITSNVDACPEVVDGCGLYFKNGDYADLAKKILQLAEEPGLRNYYSLRSLIRASKFTWDRQILLYEQTYKSILK